MQYAVRSRQCAVRSLQYAVRSFLFIVFLFTVHSSSGQQVILSGFDPMYVLQHYQVHDYRMTNHSAVQPLLNTDINIQKQDENNPGTYIITIRNGLDKLSSRYTFGNIYTKPSDQPADEWSTKPFVFGIKPIYDISAGYDLKASSPLLTTAGGIRIGGDYKQKIGFDLRLAAGTTTLTNYQDSLASYWGFVPGWGDRAYMLDSTKYGFQHLSGNIIWRPTPVFNLQVGRDKHFWGDGHRSLFLGDQGPAFPYVKMQTTIWKLQYTSLFAWMEHGSSIADSSVIGRGKFASFHYLSFNAAKWLNISIFEAVVWQGTDPNRQRGFDPNYLNPLVFFRPVEYSLGSSDNSMLGIAGKIRFNRNNVLYAQIILDEFYLKEIKAWKDGWWANKQGAQVGYKCYNFGMVENLFMQMELNIVRPYTYSHGSPQQSYSNGPLPLAHPMGANFAEFIGILSYHIKGLTLTGQVTGIRYGADVNDTMNYGQNVFQSYITRENEYGNKVFQGCPTNVFLAKLNAAYVFNTKFPLRLQLTAIARSEKTKWNDPALGSLERTLKTSFVMVGLSLPLWRPQDDY